MTLSTLDARSALVVIDLQRGIVAHPCAPHSSSDVVARSAELADAFRACGFPVVLVRVTRSADGADAAPGRREVPRATGPLPDGYDVPVDELAGHSQDVIVTKRSWGAFYGTDLDLQLRRRGVTQVVLCGISTSLGVESTARSAYEHGYNVGLATDAMTDRDADAHAHSVRRIFPLLGETGGAADVLRLLPTA